MSRRVSIPTHHRVGLVAAFGLTLALALTATLAVSASAHAAATLFVNRPCYVITKTIPSMTITGSGYAPNTQVLVSSSANVDASTTATAAGTIKLTLKAPAPHFSVPSVKTFTFTAKDENTSPAAIVASSPVRVTPLGALHGSTPKAPGLKALGETTEWSFSGFTPGQTIYAHYTIQGQQVASQAFGTARGACGTLHVRAPLYPAVPHHASYPVQFDGAKSYSPKTAPKLAGRVSLNASF
jgi:hypothetical protein